MNTLSNRTFSSLFDIDTGAVIQDINLYQCVFENCSLSRTKNPKLRSIVRNVDLADCVSINCKIGPVVLEEVTVNNLDTNDLLIMWGGLFKHVTLKGNIGRIKVNLEAHFADFSKETQEPFDEVRVAFYENTDWALDIREAHFDEFELRGVPTELVRRNSNTQVVVTREKAMHIDWDRRVSAWNKHWPHILKHFLDDGDPSTILIAPRGKRKLLDGLKELRDLGVAEPN